MLDTFKLFFDEKYRGQVIGLFVERGLPTLAGVGIIIVGIAFILAGSKAGQVVGGAVELVATKGGSLVKGLKK